MCIRDSLLAARIQQAIWKKTGIYASIGLSNANPLLAKLALDIEAKHTKKMRVNWSYEDVPRKVWTIPTMTDFWGIGYRTATRLKTVSYTHLDVYKRQLFGTAAVLVVLANGVVRNEIDIR